MNKFFDRIAKTWKYIFGDGSKIPKRGDIVVYEEKYYFYIDDSLTASTIKSVDAGYHISVPSYKITKYDVPYIEPYDDYRSVVNYCKSKDKTIEECQAILYYYGYDVVTSAIEREYK